MVSPVLNPTTTTTNLGREEAILWEDWRERRGGWEWRGGGVWGLFENSCAPQSVLLQW